MHEDIIIFFFDQNFFGKSLCTKVIWFLKLMFRIISVLLNRDLIIKFLIYHKNTRMRFNKKISDFTDVNQALLAML